MPQTPVSLCSRVLSPAFRRLLRFAHEIRKKNERVVNQKSFPFRVFSPVSWANPHWPPKRGTHNALNQKAEAPDTREPPLPKGWYEKAFS